MQAPPGLVIRPALAPAIPPHLRPLNAARHPSRLATECTNDDEITSIPTTTMALPVSVTSAAVPPPESASLSSPLSSPAGGHEKETVLLDGPPVISRQMSKRSLLGGGVGIGGHGPGPAHGAGSSLLHHHHHPPLSFSRQPSKLGGGGGGLDESTTSIGGSSNSVHHSSVSSPHQQQLHQHVIAQAHLSKRPSIYLQHPLERRGTATSQQDHHHRDSVARNNGCSSNFPEGVPHHQRVWSDGDRSSVSSSVVHHQNQRQRHSRAGSVSSMGNEPCYDDGDDDDDEGQEGGDRSKPTSAAATGAAASPWWRLWGRGGAAAPVGSAVAPSLAQQRRELDATGHSRVASNGSVASFVHWNSHLQQGARHDSNASLHRVPVRKPATGSTLSSFSPALKTTTTSAAPAEPLLKTSESFSLTGLLTRRGLRSGGASPATPTCAGDEGSARASSSSSGSNLSGRIDSDEVPCLSQHPQPRHRKTVSGLSQHAESILADDVINNIEHAKKAMAYQAEFIRSFGMSSQLLQFLQINATILSFNVEWPPALERLFSVLKIFLLDFHLFKWKYSTLAACAVFPCFCYYLSEVFWVNSARWRARYIHYWPESQAAAWRACTYVIISTALVCAAVVSFDALEAVDAFALTWSVTIITAAAYMTFVGLGNLAHKLYVILEGEEERMRFFLQVRFGLRYLVLVALNLAYLPILGKLFKVIYKAKHYHEEGHHVAPAPWIVAVFLAAVYAIGLPAAIYRQIARRRVSYEWVPDPTNHEEGGRYEAKAELVAAVAGWKGGAAGGTGSTSQGVEDDDLLAYNYLELEQQVQNLSRYAHSVPLISDRAKRKAVLRRVESSLQRKQAAAGQSRRWTEAVYELARGHPIDDFWRPLRPRYYWWKLWAYYLERGFLVGLVVTQDGQKVAKSLMSIIASFIVIGGTALALLACRPYHKRNENLLESFFDLCSTFNITIALCLHEGWLAASSTNVSWVVYLILVPNLLVLVVAVYIMNPRALWRALRFKYRQFQDRSREHREREKEFADRESRALFDAVFKGDTQRVKDLLERGKADVRYEKPKEVKPVGFAGYSPTQIAVYMGHAEVLELLLAHHTLFAEEEIVRSSKAFSRYGFLFRWVVVPLSTVGAYLVRPSKLLAACSKGMLRKGERRPAGKRPWWSLSRVPPPASAKLQLLVTPTTSSSSDDDTDQSQAVLAPVAWSDNPIQHKTVSSSAPSSSMPAAPPTFSAEGSLIRYHHHDLSTPSSSFPADGSIHHRLLARQYQQHRQQNHVAKAPASAEPPHPPHHHHHGKWGTRTDSMAFESADYALGRCKGAEAGSGAAGAGVEGAKSNVKAAREEQEHFFSLVGLAFCSWSRDCLDLLLTYGSEVYEGQRLHLDHEEDDANMGASSPSHPYQGSLISVLRRRLYEEAASSPMDVKLRQTAAAALHHPRDLQWILDPERGNVMEDGDGAGGASSVNSSRYTDGVGFLVKVFRKIKHDHKSTKDMKILAMKALVEEVVAKRLTDGAILRLDLSFMGIDDVYLEHILSLWDITATGLPTSLLLEGNALTDYGIRSLVLRLRKNMLSSSALDADAAEGGAAGGRFSPLAASGRGRLASGGLSPLSAAGSHHTALLDGAYPPVASLISLNLSGNDIGTDGALFLADLIIDYQAALRSVTVFKIECSMLSARSLAYDRVVDRSLSLESALVLAIIVDAYGGVRDRLLAEQSLQQHQHSPLAKSGTIGHAGDNNDGTADGAGGLTETGTPCKLHSGGGGGLSQLHHHEQQQEASPEVQSAVKQVLAMGEKEGWKTRLMGVGGGEREFR